MNFIEGEVLYVNKPLHWSSFRVVKVVRAKLCHKLGIKKLKVGHAGTLDPLATGVMVLCTGKMTKEIDRLQAETKEYVAEIRLGATTPSFDLETAVDQEYPTDHITTDLIKSCLEQFVGEIQQIPPLFSAIKVDGTRAYHLARNNENIELKPRKVVINSIERLGFNPPHLTLRITCSKGTYIRSLARDIGKCLNSGGHLTKLERTRSGSATIEKCLQIDELDEFFEKHIQSV